MRAKVKSKESPAMKTLLSALFVLALVFAQPEAQAKRMGGGKNPLGGLAGMPNMGGRLPR